MTDSSWLAKFELTAQLAHHDEIELRLNCARCSHPKWVYMPREVDSWSKPTLEQVLDSAEEHWRTVHETREMKEALQRAFDG